MNRVPWLTILGLAAALATGSAAGAQPRPYIGYVYPAGGQQGATFPVKLGGQGLDGVNRVLVTGKGVSAKVVEYLRKIGPQEVALLREQLTELKRAVKQGKGDELEALGHIARIERRLSEYVNRPACASIASLVFVEVAIAPDADPGRRELRLATPRGVSNPLVFQVGQLPEVCRKPMTTCALQVLGKEELAVRKRPDDEIEQSITPPCTVNGQVASGELNFYRFAARKGQRLVIAAAARQLIPYIADAVPGWFQPVLAVYDSQGRELAYNDDFRFHPDPALLFEAPADGEYVFRISDAIYRGREDFVYRVTIGQVPWITSIFPLGGQAGALKQVEMQGWNLQDARLAMPPKDAPPGVYPVVARKRGRVSNAVPLSVDDLPEAFEREDNDDPARAERVTLPVIVNGRMDRGGDWDVFRFSGKAGDRVVAEVTARRLDSPLDSILKVTDAAGKLLALNDDSEDIGCGLNTHHADSYLMLRLPADGTYCVHLGDTVRGGGEEYAYRLRISPPRPDFALRLVPSSVSLRGRSSATVSVYALRKDGFAGDIQLRLKNPPRGLSSSPVTLARDQEAAKLVVRSGRPAAAGRLALTVEGSALVDGRPIARVAVAAEDRMQAFLWRHLVPAEELAAVVQGPFNQAVPKRVRPASQTATAPQAASARGADDKPKFTKQQVAGRLRQIQLLYEEWLITDEFNDRKVAECEAAQ
ncbi:MAG: PPC domain-containing protein [Pirellulales bacterium]|jgi:hypothetical protein|nr:PPC domain-containing protein [Thermoguttaceae bacterium]MDD4785603.1 PPC domain-containing protein [Pirellulales bacterium]MDI9444503.1 PPC domain-containing protein [Planctomycetota bacterium]NLZ02080.1 hypothetical protein [Pirellulaceae bacterium]